MNKLEYSIIYAVIRPETGERLSVGIVFSQNNEIEVRYSDVKLDAIKRLIPVTDYAYLRTTLRSMAGNKSLESMAIFDYLNRYSNNVLTVSRVQTVKMDSSKISKEKLYQMYVYKNVSVA